MGKVTTVKGNLFDAPKGSILLHACNCRGMWGSGIAKEFAKRFPEAYVQYKERCETYGHGLLGTCFLIPAGDYTVGCFFTSVDYGKLVDSPEEILDATKTAVADLLRWNPDKKEVHTCKINSGLFRVPWQNTKKILKESEIDFVVYEY
jgi:ADP-ribose 1''-phosphate phosphatase